ncbi:SIR2 family protein [Mariniflexile litorale]|uniref:SIR2 family protein n=1 Tax=Mariniflexile litorale TaxID=3045158 RepID=A0AAU7EI15_9FLAO|nr:SIR2 family protein [Mariniflexile sp. KMM 9835]MDQ8209985.1 SIR2 family protein [Mariniflexile sp. KMM 9835]
MTTHDPIKHIKFLRQTLSQDKKPLGFFISAGCPLAVNMPDDKWPLIPDVAKLTQFVTDELKSKTEEKNNFDKLIDEVILSNLKSNNIEDILSFLRGLKEVSVGNSVRGFTKENLVELEKNICDKIVEKLEVNLPDKDTPYHKLAQWISIDREKPIEVFTTNYDLLLEEAFEDLSIPYFDGFVGSRQSFFDLRAVEDNLIPKHWTRLWKIHGSINWFQKENKEVYRSSLTKANGDSYLIYPSHLKYEQSRKMPYLALIDQLNRFIRLPNSLLIISGYSFNDQHLNDTIINALKSNPNSMAIALMFDTMTYEKGGEIIERYPEAIERAKRRNNLALWSYDEAMIGTVRGKWKISDDIEDEDNLAECYDKKVHQLKLGNFSKLGDFLQALIGDKQTNLDEK